MTGRKGDCLYKYQLYDVKRRLWWYQRSASQPSILYHSHLISMTSITVTKNTSAYNANKRPKKPQNISLNVNQLFLLCNTEKCVCFFPFGILSKALPVSLLSSIYLCCHSLRIRYMGAIYSSTCKQVCRKDNRIQIWRRHTNQPNNKLLRFAKLLK